MFKTFKYRLEPNVNQTRELNIALETHRRLYNLCLERRKTSYSAEKRSIGYFEQCAWFTSERKINPWFSHLTVSSAKATMKRLERAFRAFFRKAKSGNPSGYPRFKSRDRFNGFTYPAIGHGFKIIGSKLRLQHIGTLRINLHRQIVGEIKTISIKRELDNWYVIVCCDLPDIPITENNLPAIGIDVGIENFLTASDGYTEPALQPLKVLLPKFRIETRKFSRKKKGSASRRKQRKVVAKLHAKVANARRDQHHKIAKRLTSRYGVIAVESLNIRRMLGNHRLARAVSDAGWFSFLTILKHHAESAGVWVIEVDARGTSQTCPECGVVAKKVLSQRKHSCDCGYSTHRDHAAAKVILSRGLAGMQPRGRNVGDVMPHDLKRCLP
jgi:putative transposase